MITEHRHIESAMSVRSVPSIEEPEVDIEKVEHIRVWKGRSDLPISEETHLKALDLWWQRHPEATSNPTLPELKEEGLIREAQRLLMTKDPLKWME